MKNGQLVNFCQVGRRQHQVSLNVPTQMPESYLIVMSLPTLEPRLDVNQRVGETEKRVNMQMSWAQA